MLTQEEYELLEIARDVLTDLTIAYESAKERMGEEIFQAQQKKADSTLRVRLNMPFDSYARTVDFLGRYAKVKKCGAEVFLHHLREAHKAEKQRNSKDKQRHE